MRILVAVVHHWNPAGGGKHASLRPNVLPRKEALQQQLLSLRRLGPVQGTIDFSTLNFKPVNEALGHMIDIRLITDGKNTVIDHLDNGYKPLFKEERTNPSNSFHLGFEAQRFLASKLEDKYDLYCYMEDDLVVNDPLLLHKIYWFNKELGDSKLVLPHRVEFMNTPQSVQKLYIDGPLDCNLLKTLIPDPPQSLVAGTPAGRIIYESPSNPHSGCFFLTHSQLDFWRKQSSWQDGDVSYVSPLESAATLGIAKNFTLYKPLLEYAAWMEIQHWGASFICNVLPPKDSHVEDKKGNNDIKDHEKLAS